MEFVSQAGGQVEALASASDSTITPSRISRRAAAPGSQKTMPASVSAKEIAFAPKRLKPPTHAQLQAP